jgi:hypothetical protein
MPVGGTESGLFRFPRVGEKVLVGTEENTHYLMGYLPTSESSSRFQLAGMSQDDGRGAVFRYQQTGKKEGKEGDEPYSEIGFYHKPTAWKPSEDDTGNYADTAEGYPKVDRIHIQSTGDIHTKAKNHHRMKAKRFELFVDCEPPKKEGDTPFGDREVDDSFLYAGDAHIRAKNRLVIKAGESIELRVGRSSIVINDEGIIIASRKTQSVYSSWDTVLDLKGSAGLSMFGQHVKIRGGIDYTLSEGYGGSLSSRLGVMRVAGFDIRAETLNTYNYIARGLGNGIDFLFNLGTMITGASGAESAIGDATKSFSVSPLLNFVASKGSSETAGGPDFQGIMLDFLDILLSVLGVIEMVLEMTIPKKDKRDKHGRDGLYTALALVEYGLILECFRELCLPSMLYAFFEASLHLTSQSKVLIDAQAMEANLVWEKTGNTPAAGLSTKETKEVYKDGFTKFKDKLVSKLSIAKVVGGVGVGLAVAGGLITGKVLTAQQDAALEAELRSL